MSRNNSNKQSKSIVNDETYEEMVNSIKRLSDAELADYAAQIAANESAYDSAVIGTVKGEIMVRDAKKPFQEVKPKRTRKERFTLLKEKLTDNLSTYWVVLNGKLIAEFDYDSRHDSMLEIELSSLKNKGHMSYYRKNKKQFTVIQELTAKIPGSLNAVCTRETILNFIHSENQQVVA